MTETNWEINMRFENCGYYLLDREKEVKWLRTKTERNNEMTDKQIIIDEMDVTSCIYSCRKLNKDGLHDCKIPNTAPFCCENIRNCYYKQLKRKEQECERLKRDYFKQNEWLQEQKNELDQLTAELEQEKALKETYLACYKAKHEDIEGKLFNLKSENDELKRQIEVERKDNWSVRGQLGEAECLLCRYDRTLTEIKEIAEKIDDSGGCAYGDYDCDNCSSLEQETICTYKVKKLILQKISEVDINESK